MNRRQFILSTSTIPFLAGCLSNGEGQNGNEESEENTSESSDDDNENGSEPLDFDAEFTTRTDQQVPGDGTPRVQALNGEIVVEGDIVIGSSSCNEAYLRSVEYDGSENAFELIVGARKQEEVEPGEPCTDDIATRQYRVRITHNTSPNTMFVTEQNNHDPHETTEHELYSE